MLEEGLKPGKIFSNQDYSRVYTYVPLIPAPCTP